MQDAASVGKQAELARGFMFLLVLMEPTGDLGLNLGIS